MRADGKAWRGRAWLTQGGHLAAVSRERGAGDLGCCALLGADPMRWTPREVRRGGLHAGLVGGGSKQCRKEEERGVDGGEERGERREKKEEEK